MVQTHQRRDRYMDSNSSLAGKLLIAAGIAQNDFLGVAMS